jgi:hypothetical protein
MQKPACFDLLGLKNDISISTSRRGGDNILIERKRYKHYDHKEIDHSTNSSHGLRSKAKLVSIVILT